ncbi:methyltransferase [Ancylobacter sp. IITR112]|uniref:class I SAM-dependent methyltransferase n=1 Tax=Ancylobacter sp. IITR112 TaxID=3138073 RepID=UPI003529FFF0
MGHRAGDGGRHTLTPRGIADPAAFIRAETQRLAPPLVPEITLHLAEESLPIWQRTEEELGEIGLPPPFWAFAWAGGQALARYILDHPDTVRGKRVLDFASGSGLVGIAAAKAGAAHVACADIDPFAQAAIALNAGLNGAGPLDVITSDVLGTRGVWEVVLAGDIAYERDLAGKVFAWLEALSAADADVWIGDPGRSYLPRQRLEKVADYAVPVSRELEDTEIKATAVWRPRR